MRIYIDEAGAFVVPSSAQSLFSLVLAVVVPSSAEDALFAEFSTLCDGWSSQGREVKGSKLNESQAAQLLDLASRHDLFVKFFAVDMATHDDVVVGEYKSRQADGVIANLTLEHHPNIAAQLEGRRRSPAAHSKMIPIKCLIRASYASASLKSAEPRELSTYDVTTRSVTPLLNFTNCEDWARWPRLSNFGPHKFGPEAS